MAVRFLLLPLLFGACSAQAGEVFYRVFGQNSVVLGPICVPDVDGVVVDPAIDFNLSGLFITIYASGSATVFTYTGADLDDGPDSVTWGAPAASAIEVDALANDCLRLHIRDEVFDVANSVEWGIKISDSGTAIMDHTAQVLAIDSAAVMAAAVHADLATGTPIPVNVVQISDDANADDTFEAWIDAAAVPSDLIKVNGTNAVSAAGRPEVNTTHFGGTAATSSGGRPEVNSTLFSGVATGSATLAAADDAVIAAIAAVETGITWSSSWDAEVESEVLDALVSLELDQLLSTTYNPAAEPAADSLFGDLTESDGGVTRFNVNALELAPTGAGGDGSAFTAIPWNVAWDAEVQSEAADAINADTGDSFTAADDAVLARLPAALVSGRIDASVGAMGADVVTAAAIAASAIGASEIATDAIGAAEIAADAIGSAETAASFSAEVQQADVDLIETLDATDQLDAHAASGLDAAGVRAAVGLAAANLDTQMANVESGVDVDTIEGVDATNQLDTHAAAGLDAAGVRAAVGLASANLDTQIGAVPTVQEIMDHVVDGTLDVEEILCYLAAVLVNESDFDDTGLDSAEFMNAAGTAPKVTVTYAGTSGQDRSVVTLAACGS